MKREQQKLLISLDVLLDTRLATLAKMDASYPPIVLENGWKTRDGDFYEQWIENFDRDKFNTHYWYRGDEGDIHTNSLMTGYMTRLTADVNLIRDASENHPMAGGVVVDINVWPYKFSEEEKGVLAGVIREYLGEICEVGIVDIALEELTPKAIRSNWCSFSLYRFDDWFSIHNASLLDNPMPSVVCVAPRLLHKPLTHSDEMDPTLEVSGALVEFLGVEWITPQEVSIII